MVGATVAHKPVMSAHGIRKKSVTTSTTRHTQQSTVPSISKRGSNKYNEKDRSDNSTSISNNDWV